MRILTVDVTREDIDNGVKGNTRGCPIACAMLRALNAIEYNRYQVAIGNDSFGIFDTQRSQVYEFQTPEIATYFIDNFDRNKEVSPFRFEFDLNTGKPTTKGLHNFASLHSHIAYIQMYNGDWNFPKTEVPEFKSKKVGSGYGLTLNVPLQYKKIVSLDKDIKEISEIKEPTIAELERFINSYEELSPDYALVKL